MCSQRMTAGAGGWDIRMSLGEVRLEKKVFVLSWGWGQPRNGDHSRFLATDRGIRLWGLDLRRNRRGVSWSLAYLLTWEVQPLG